MEEYYNTTITTTTTSQINISTHSTNYTTIFPNEAELIKKNRKLQIVLGVTIAIVLFVYYGIMIYVMKTRKRKPYFPEMKKDLWDPDIHFIEKDKDRRKQLNPFCMNERIVKRAKKIKKLRKSNAVPYERLTNDSGEMNDGIILNPLSIVNS
ncbi:hypothetical protein SNEBB_002825 [Seison nebaliae]|nr:hypothetical protein SNEBB_002825 [Seison nebaliae]